jgi:DNA-binding HxlR family transcriptional regulator
LAEASLGIARNVLTDRLNRLVEEGIFERVLYQGVQRGTSTA